jgi:hypothetical protein
VGNAVVQSLAAGYLWRREGRWRSMLLPYAELAFATFLVLSPVIFSAFDLTVVWNRGYLVLLLAVVVAVTGVLRRWRFLLRLSLYGILSCGLLSVPGLEALVVRRQLPETPAAWLFFVGLLLSALCAAVLVAFDAGRRTRTT